LGIRKTHWPALSASLFNLGQIALAAWTFIALAILIYFVSRGLLGSPNMQIEGNGATAQLLSWFADRASPTLPSAWVISVPLWIYRGLMLLWALWLAFALLQWLKWGWMCFTTDGYWRAREKSEKKEEQEKGNEVIDANAATMSEPSKP
jgi:hypothetical protein